MENIRVLVLDRENSHNLWKETFIDAGGYTFSGRVFSPTDTNKRELSNGTLIPTPSVKDSEIVESFFGTVSDEEYLQNLSPEEFEQEILGLFQKAGYRCHLTSKQPTESGTDIVAIKNDKTIAIQCKHTRKNKKQGRDAIRQLVAEAVPTYPNAIYIAATNYYFNNNARDLAKSHNIGLIEKDKLLKFVDNPKLINIFIEDNIS